MSTPDRAAEALASALSRFMQTDHSRAFLVGAFSRLSPACRDALVSLLVEAELADTKAGAAP